MSRVRRQTHVSQNKTLFDIVCYRLVIRFSKSAPNNTAFKMVMCVLEQFYCCTQIVFSLGGREQSETIIIQKE